MKKKLSLIGLAIILLALVYQGTMAVIQESTNVNTKMNAASLGIAIVTNDQSKDEDNDKITFENALPGKMINHNLKVENTKNKDVYVRVTLTKYWEDKNGKKVVEADARFIELLGTYNDWIVIDDSANSNNEVMYFYYKKPLKSKSISSSFLEKIKCSSSLEDQKYSQYQMKVDVEVDAIQTVGAQDAILSEWGMDVTFDNNKNIVSVEE